KQAPLLKIPKVTWFLILLSPTSFWCDGRGYVVLVQCRDLLDAGFTLIDITFRQKRMMSLCNRVLGTTCGENLPSFIAPRYVF
ncbi:hypothetical protein CGH62_27070, partial [Vibrio parahaemolyticus]